MWKKLLVFLAAIGPGIFLVGYNIGTGSLTTMASAGADYGMLLTWPLLLSCIFTYILIVAFGRFTAITGHTALYAFKTEFGRPAALFVLIALLVSEVVSSIGVMAVVTEAVGEWSRPLTKSGEGFSTITLAAVFGLLLYAIFWHGRYGFFERVLAVFVGLMGLSFVLTMFMVIPDPVQVIEGMVPRLPEEANAALLMAGMVGTTMGAVLYVVRSILVKEKGWTINELNLEKRDARISVGLMFVLSIAIMACAAGTLYPRGLRVENAIDMVRLLEPLAGRFAISIFVAGIVAAGLSSLFPTAILAPWLLADYRNTARDLTTVQSRVLVFIVIALGLTVPIFGGRPVLVMIVSQAFMTIALPVVVCFMFILQNRRSVLGEHVAGRWMNVAMGIILAFSLVMAVIGIVGISDLL